MVEAPETISENSGTVDVSEAQFENSEAFIDSHMEVAPRINTSKTVNVSSSGYTLLLSDKNWLKEKIRITAEQLYSGVKSIEVKVDVLAPDDSIEETHYTGALMEGDYADITLDKKLNYRVYAMLYDGISGKAKISVRTIKD